MVDPASVSPSDLLVQQIIPIVLPAPTIPATDVHVDGATVTFYLPTNTPYAYYRATLPAGSVTDAAGNPLSSGLAVDFDYNLTSFLAGDANFDGVVDDADYQILVANYGQSPRNFSQGNFDESGTGVDVEDLALLAGNYQPGPRPFFEPNLPAQGQTILSDVFIALPNNPVGLGLEDFEISRNGGEFVSLAGNPAVGLDFFGPENRVAHLLTNFTLSLPGEYRIRLNPAGWTSDGQAPLPAELTYRYNVVDGDYNLDGMVDAADYTVWRNTLGMVGIPLYSGADGNGNGMIDADDYLVWKANYGNSSPAAVTMAVAPPQGDPVAPTPSAPPAPPAQLVPPTLLARAEAGQAEPRTPEGETQPRISSTAAGDSAPRVDASRDDRGGAHPSAADQLAASSRRDALHDAQHDAVWSGVPLTFNNVPRIAASPLRSEPPQASFSPSPHLRDAALLLWLESTDSPTFARKSAATMETGLDENTGNDPTDKWAIWSEELSLESLDR